MRDVQNQAPPMSSKTMIGMMLVLVVMMVVMMFRAQIGQALDFVFKYIAFDGQYPVLTLVIAGVIMITFSTIVRSLMTDPIKMARNQQIQSDFNKEFRQARIENNLFKMKKLQEMQPQIMAMSMEASTQQMKTMPITMVVLMPVYAWVWYFLIAGVDATTGVEGVYFTATNPPLVDIPWAADFDLNTTIWFFPSWIIIYTLVSMPIGQIENRLIRYFLLNRKLKELDRLAQRAEIE
ncbi:MAG: EMC3/TMCO1 family protein [Thermoplasmata archaeon]|nr:EMC3/TMCO1 family protein [Thermoplasmata archaeon]